MTTQFETPLPEVTPPTRKIHFYNPPVLSPSKPSFAFAASLETTAASLATSRSISENLAQLQLDDHLSGLSDSIARVCLENSNAIVRATSELSENTASGVADFSCTTSRDSLHLCEGSVALVDVPLKDNLAHLSDLAKQNVFDLVSSTSASSAAFSDAFLSENAHLHYITDKNQNEMLFNLQQQLSKNVDDIVHLFL